MRGDPNFGSNNYYGRLVQLLQIDPKTDKKAAKKIEGAFRQDSLELWNGLNSWLHDQDGALGTPTAYSFDWRAYVGVPISQALLRDSFGAWPAGRLLRNGTRSPSAQVASERFLDTPVAVAQDRAARKEEPQVGTRFWLSACGRRAPLRAPVSRERQAGS
jgi:hypothetical protein